MRESAKSTKESLGALFVLAAARQTLALAIVLAC
jgi:hypothetical protein